MKKYYQLTTASREADVMIYGDITSWRWDESDVSSYTLSREIAGLDVDRINVYINSYGGEVKEALAIYNALKRHPAKIKTVCDGFACSAASVIFMAGDERVMHAASLLMIHNAWSGAEGNAGQLRKAADDLDTISATAAQTYRAAVNISDEELAALLDAESWITPADALTMGFATAVVNDPAAAQPNASARRAVYARMTAKAETPPPPASPAPPPPQEPDPVNTLKTFLDNLSAN